MKSNHTHIIIILLLISISIGACNAPAPEATPTVIPPTPLPLTEAPPTAAIVISTQAPTAEPLPTDAPAPAIPADLGVINWQTVTLVEEIVVIPVADITGLEFSPDGRYLRLRTNLSPDTHQDIYLDLTTGMEAMRLEGSQRVYFNPNSASIVSLDGRSLVEYDLQTGVAIAGYNSQYEVAALSPDGEWLVVFEEIDPEGPGTTFQIVDIAVDEVVHRIFVNAVLDKDDFLFSSDGEVLAATFSPSRDKYVTTFWSIKTGKAINSVYKYSEIAFHPLGFEVAASYADQDAISLLRMDTWEQKRYLGYALEGPNFYSLGYTSYGGLLYALYDGIATYPCFWYPDTGDRIWLQRNMDLLALSISPTSRLMATSDKRGYVTLWGLPQ